MLVKFYLGSRTLFRNFLMLGEEIYHSKNPLETVINPKIENALKSKLFMLSRPS
jgi:hypothetical protein